MTEMIAPNGKEQAAGRGSMLDCDSVAEMVVYALSTPPKVQVRNTWYIVQCHIANCFQHFFPESRGLVIRILCVFSRVPDELQNLPCGCSVCSKAHRRKLLFGWSIGGQYTSPCSRKRSRVLLYDTPQTMNLKFLQAALQLSSILSSQFSITFVDLKFKSLFSSLSTSFIINSV